MKAVSENGQEWRDKKYQSLEMTGVGAKAASGQVPRWHTHKLNTDNSQATPLTSGPGREYGKEKVKPGEPDQGIKAGIQQHK